MPGRRSRKVAIVERQQKVANLYLQSWTQMAIAAELGITQPVVCTDLKAIQAEWRESSIRDFDALREIELRKMDLLESAEQFTTTQLPVDGTRFLSRSVPMVIAAPLLTPGRPSASVVHIAVDHQDHRQHASLHQ